MVEFTESMLIGVEHIDQQHRELVAFLNKTLELCAAQTLSKEIIDAELNFLGQYALNHFRDEEALQIKSNYPDYKRHKELHEEFIVTFNSLELELSYEKNMVPAVFSRILTEKVFLWLVVHIMKEDIEFGRYYNKVKQESC